MRKILLIGALLAVSACGRYDSSYQPKLAKPAADPVKYEADRQACFGEVSVRQDRAQKEYRESGRHTAGAAFGILGSAVDIGTADPDKDYSKTPMQMFDECMTAKGYKVVSQ